MEGDKRIMCNLISAKINTQASILRTFTQRISLYNEILLETANMPYQIHVKLSLFKEQNRFKFKYKKQ